MAIDWTRDEIILVCDLISANDWRGVRATQQAVREMSDLLRRAQIHPVDKRDPSFRSTDSVQRKSFDIATQHPDYSGKPTKGNKLDRTVLLDFLAEPDRMRSVARAVRLAILSGTPAGLPVEEIDPSSIVASEGSLLLSQHLRRERNPRLRRKKLEEVAGAGRRPTCEVCEFDFGQAYGTVGEGYIEVHHRLPLHASGPRVTRLEDLSLVCSNCHRMLHRSKKWLAPEDLRGRLISAGVTT